MIIGKIKLIIKEFREKRNFLVGQSKETEWAHIYHDTIRGRKWLEELAISPGRRAANYSFLYILTKILADFKPKKIMEFGLGESSKIISSFIVNELKDSSHVIVEQSSEWIDAFNTKYSMSSNSTILHLELDIMDIKGYPVKTYRAIKDKIVDTFDLYIVDGPGGTDRYSRHDICLLAEKFKPADEFIIIIDDYHRRGEKDTVRDLIEILTKTGIKTYTCVYAGNKAQIVISSSKYRYATSL